MTIPLTLEERFDDEDGAPLYAKLKDYIRARIVTGDWPQDHRIPSENELVDRLGISRMTANRALRELADEGVLVRIRGKGSFVAPRKRSSAFRSVPNIAEEIANRGGRHSVDVIVLQEEVCGPDLAEDLGLGIGDGVFHSVLVHREDDLPIQIEDRFVNPAVAPGYLGVDFHASTPNGYLSDLAPIARAEQFIEAVAAQPWEGRLLSIPRTEPCLLIRRRTWSDDRIVSSVRLLYPGTRYTLESIG